MLIAGAISLFVGITLIFYYSSTSIEKNIDAKEGGNEEEDRRVKVVSFAIKMIALIIPTIFWVLYANYIKSFDELEKLGFTAQIYYFLAWTIITSLIAVSHVLYTFKLPFKGFLVVFIILGLIFKMVLLVQGFIFAGESKFNKVSKTHKETGTAVTIIKVMIWVDPVVIMGTGVTSCILVMLTGVSVSTFAQQ